MTVQRRKGGPFMRIFCLCLILCLLCGCGSEELDSAWLQADAYTASTYNAMSQDNLYLKSNGDLIVGVHYADEQTAGLYRLALQDNQVSTTYLCDAHSLTAFDLLGVDGDNGIFVTGTDSQGMVCVLRLDETGRETLRIDFPKAPDRGVYSFTWDQAHYYFLVNYWSQDPEQAFDGYLEVYDHQGQQIAQQELSHSLAETAGYLPREAEWMEELEGRDEDLLLSMLFPEGPQDTTGLLRLSDGSPAMLICRRSPIDGERYGILCTMGESFQCAPACYYPVESCDGWPLCTYFESRDPQYDLLINCTDGLLGLHMDDGSTTPLFAWDPLDYSAANLTAMQPGNAAGTCIGPKGTLWLRCWNMELDGFELNILTPTE